VGIDLPQPLITTGGQQIFFKCPPLRIHEEMSTRIYGAFACGINVYLNAHTDQDFTFGAVSIQMKQEYTNDMDTVVYFCFPRLGLAVPLRPGDVLFFNPLEPHCYVPHTFLAPNILLSKYRPSSAFSPEN
jgi:mannose-6-phosphate isomerase class I